MTWPETLEARTKLKITLLIDALVSVRAFLGRPHIRHGGLLYKEANGGTVEPVFFFGEAWNH